MRLLNLFKTAVICTALSACATGSEEFEWRPYKDIDGAVKQMRFVEQTTAYEMDKPAEERDLTEFKGYAVSRKNALSAEQNVGYMAYLRNAQGFMATIFNLGERSLNPQKSEDMQLLAKAKVFDFYEFGQFRLSHARFSSKQGICADFQGKNGVDLLMTTNYYPENSFTDFSTALINVKLQAQNPPAEIGYTPSFSGNNPKLQQKMAKSEMEHGKKLAQNNVLEKASILFNIICK